MNISRWMLVVFLGCLLAKCWLIHYAAAGFPNNDQWKCVVEQTLIPYHQHTLKPFDLFRPYNEHRLVFQRIYDLALFDCLHHFDNRLQCVVNALAHSSMLALLCGLLMRSTRHWGIPAAILLLGMAPWAWENVVIGFQAQMYFLVGFSLAAIAFWSTARPGPEGQFRWNTGWLFGLCSLFSMASGCLCAAAMMPFMVKQRGRLVSLAVLVVAGLWLRYGFDPGWNGCPEALRTQSHSLWDSTVSFLKCLAFPAVTEPWLAPVMMAPLALYWFHAQGGKQKTVVLAIALWILLQCAAVAVERGSDGRGPVGRYFDFIGLLLPLGVVALVRLRNPLLTGAWLAVVFGNGLALACHDFDSELYVWKLNQVVWADNTRKVLESTTPEAMRTCPPPTLEQQILPWVYAPEDFWRLIHQPDTTNIVHGIAGYQPTKP